mmetsp:Transcript_16111/g.40763  ORF Transcript_16111/g.40763 Transcript_16111/m.40763 type:complete len:93 (+) Transcript_16111:46-324(+)
MAAPSSMVLEQERAWTQQRMTWLRRSSEFDLTTEQRTSAEKRAQRAASFRQSRLGYDEIEECMQAGSPFPHPVPLATMVAVLTEMWEEEGIT